MGKLKGCLKWLCIFCALSIGPSVLFAQTDSNTDFVNSTYNITIETEAHIKQEFQEVLRANGFTDKVINKVPRLYLPHLIRSLQPNNEGLVDWKDVNLKIAYWKKLLQTNSQQKDSLNELIYNTKDINPFMFLEIDLKKWKTVSDFMLRWGFFSSENGFEIKSLRSFILSSNALESSVFLSQKPYEEWMLWDKVFRQSKISPQELGQIFWTHILHGNKSTAAGFTTLQQVLEPSIASTLIQYPKLISPEVLATIFKSKPSTIIANTENIIDVVDMIGRYQNSLSPKKRIELLVHELTDMIKKSEIQNSLSRKGPKSLRRSCKILY